MAWIIVQRRPTDQFVYVENSSVKSDDAKDATRFECEDKAIAQMMEWGLSAEDYFITELFSAEESLLEASKKLGW